jgi:TPP-dependent pyruvate/acetoin dehydrogenase alpha subunit
MQVGKEKLLWMYEKMVQIRYYEETMAAVYMEGKHSWHSSSRKRCRAYL